MLTSLVIVLEAARPLEIPGFTGHAAHAVLLDLVTRRSPTLAELIDEGASLITGGRAVDRQTRLYPIGTALALAHVLKRTADL